MKKENFLKRNWLVILCGLLVGAAAVVLTAQGNPKNMGFCIACFLRDIAGALQLQSASASATNTAGIVSYFRPEIVGLIVGACILAIVTKEFKPKGGSSPFTRFVLGGVVMMGALVFLGCPLRMVIRIGGGDLNAIVGLAGFIAGILIGIVFLKGGFSLGRAYKQRMVDGLLFPVGMIILLGLSLIAPGEFAISNSGPGSMQAPVIIALCIALVVGALAQRSRMCMVGGIRDAVMFKEFGLLAGFGGVLIAVLVGNLITGNLKFGFDGQAVAHTDGLWNFLGMTVVGWGSVLLGGCPLLQLILAGEGNSDSAVTVVGMVAGAAMSHIWKIAGTAQNLAKEVKGGASENTKTAMIACVVVLLVISLVNMKKEKSQ